MKRIILIVVFLLSLSIDLGGQVCAEPDSADSVANIIESIGDSISELILSSERNYMGHEEAVCQQLSSNDSSNKLQWFSIILAIFSIILTIFLGLIIPNRRKIKYFIDKQFVVKYVYSASAINKKLSQNNYLNLENTSQLSGKYLEYDSSEKKEMTIRNYKGQQQTIALPYKEIVNFIKDPCAQIKIDPLEMDKADIHTGDELIKSLLCDDDDSLFEATKLIEEKVRKEKPNTYNGSHPRLKTLTEQDGSYICSFEKTCYFAQIRTNLSLDYPFTYKGHNTTFREIEMAGKKALKPIDESKLANVIGVSAIWCMDNEDGDPKNQRFFLLPRVSDVGVYANRWGCPAGDIECPKEGKFKTNSLVEFLTWEIAREFFEETGVQNEVYDPNMFKDKVEPEYFDENKDKLKLDFDIKFKNMLVNSYKCRKMEIIPLAFLREMLRGGKPMAFFLIRTERIEIGQLHKSFHKSMGDLEFKKNLLSSAPLSTEATCNYLYAQAYLQGKSNTKDCIDLSR